MAGLQNKVSDAISYWNARTRDLQNDWAKWQDYYLCEPGKIERSGQRSNVFVPEFLRAVEALVVRVFYRIFLLDRFFTAERNPEYDAGDKSEALIQRVESGMLEQFKNMLFKTEFLGSLRSLIINGFSIGKVYWKTLEQIKGRKIKTTKGAEVFYGPERTFDGPYYEAMYPGQVIFDVDAPDIQSSEFAVEVNMLSAADLRARVAAKLYDKDVVETYITSNPSGRISPQGNTFANQQLLILQSVQNFASIRYDVYTYWGLSDQGIPIRGDILGDTTVVMNESRNLFFHQLKPFVHAKVTTLPGYKYGRFSGIGVGRIGSSGQVSINDNRNKFNDLLSFSTYNMWKRLRDANILDSDLILRPIGVVDTDDMNGLDAIRPDLASLQFNLKADEIEKDELRIATAAATILQSSPVASKTETLGEVQIIKGEADARISLMAYEAATTCLTQVLNLVYALNKQYLEAPVYFQGGQMTPEDIFGNPTFRVRPNVDIQDRLVVNSQLLQFLNVVGAIARTDPGIRIKTGKIISRIWRNFAIPEEMAEEIVEEAPPTPLPPPPPAGLPNVSTSVTGNQPNIPATPGEVMKTISGTVGPRAPAGV